MARTLIGNVRGPQGLKGDTGERGPQGLPGEMTASSVAALFSSSTAYGKGDYVTYSGQLYRFTADHAAGDWTGSDATAVAIVDEFKSTFVAEYGVTTFNEVDEQVQLGNYVVVKIDGLTGNFYATLNGVSFGERGFGQYTTYHFDVPPDLVGEVIHFVGYELSSDEGWATHYTDLDAVNTGLVSQFTYTKAYNVGDYVVHNGVVYKFTTPHTAGNYWSNSEVTQAVLADDLSDLKSAINDPVTGLDTKAPVITNTASGSIASFDDGADGMQIKALTVNIEPVQSGTGNPSPTNVRPISGWTGCNVTRTGKNLLNNVGTSSTISGITWTVNDDGSVTANGTASGNSFFRMSNAEHPLFLPGGTTVIASGCPAGGSDAKYELTITSLPTGGSAIAHDYGSGSTVSATEDTAYGCQLCVRSGVTVDNIKFWPMVRAASDTNPAYAKYVSPTVYPIAFPSEAGTVYGGTLTINADGSGELVPTMAKKVFNGTENWALSGNYPGAFYVPLAGISPLPTVGPAVCSHAVATNGIQYNYGEFLINSLTFSIYIMNSGTTVAQFKQFLAECASANKPLELVYTLSTFHDPIPLTAEQITTLLGQNNMWADCGPVSVDYPADTKLYIQKINAPTDDDMTADTQIESGKYFLIGNTLYLSTTTIPAGDTIIPGTNCQKTNLAAALNALNT